MDYYTLPSSPIIRIVPLPSPRGSPAGLSSLIHNNQNTGSPLPEIRISVLRKNRDSECKEKAAIAHAAFLEGNARETEPLAGCARLLDGFWSPPGHDYGKA